VQREFKTGLHIVSNVADCFMSYEHWVTSDGLQRDVLARDAERKTKPTDLDEPQSADFAS